MLRGLNKYPVSAFSDWYIRDLSYNYFSIYKRRGSSYETQIRISYFVMNPRRPQVLSGKTGQADREHMLHINPNRACHAASPVLFSVFYLIIKRSFI